MCRSRHAHTIATETKSPSGYRETPCRCAHRFRAVFALGRTRPGGSPCVAKQASTCFTGCCTRISKPAHPFELTALCDRPPVLLNHDGHDDHQNKKAFVPIVSSW